MLGKHHLSSVLIGQCDAVSPLAAASVLSPSSFYNSIVSMTGRRTEALIMPGKDKPCTVLAGPCDTVTSASSASFPTGA